MIALVVNATLGAIVLLIILRLISGLAAGDGVAVSGGVGIRQKHPPLRTHDLHLGRGDRPVAAELAKRLGLAAALALRPNQFDWFRRKPVVADRGLGRLNWADSAPSGVASGRAGIPAIAAVPLRARSKAGSGPSDSFRGTRAARPKGAATSNLASRISLAVGQTKEHQLNAGASASRPYSQDCAPEKRRCSSDCRFYTGP
jgi:hypothetical protein